MTTNRWICAFFGINLLSICCSIAADTSTIESLLERAEDSIRGNQNITIGLIESAERLIEEQGLDEHKPRLLNLKAHLNILSSNLTIAYEKAVEAEQLARQQENTLQLAEAIRKQGIINYFLNFDAEAIELLTDSLLLHQQLNSPYVLNNLQSIGNVYARNDAWADSLIEIGEELVEKAILNNHQHFQGQGYGFIASGLIKKQAYKDAVLLCKRAMEHLSEKNYIILYYAAKAELALGNPDEALEHINSHLEKIEEHQSTLSLLAANNLKSQILFQLNLKSEALKLLRQTLALAENTDFTNYQQEALEMLADFYRKEQEYEKALVYFQRFSKLKEEVFNETQSRQLAFSRARLEVVQKNQQIKDLEVSKQLTLQQNKQQLVIIVLILTIAVCLLILYWRMRRQKRLLQNYSDELKHANEAKSQFLARMSHEIRTPINAIIGLTKLTQKQKLTKAQQDVNLRQIEESSQTLLGVINDILDFSKIEAGKLNIDCVPFELDKVVDQATRLQMLKAHEKGLELVQYIARDVPLYLKGDALRIGQILNNLISNAVKFTSKGMVAVRVEKKYSSSDVILEFSVKDTGIGLSEEQVGRLFDSFSQADESTTRRFGGTGLGLAICKQLVELMGGEIRVESQPDEGSTFYFTIKVEEEVVTHPDKEVPGTALSDLRVLVVDDLDMCRQAAAEVLLRVNVNPDLVESGAQAIEKVRLSMQDNAPYDLVLLDWHMPDLDGIEVASIINQQFPHSRPNIVMLSAYDVNELQELGAPLGIQNYLEKPINTSSLIEVITRITHEYTPKILHRVLAPPVKEKVVPNLSRCNILLVEDNDLNRKVATGFLEETSANVSVAEDGQVAVDMLSSKPNFYDLVLMDLQMPVMDGFKATQIIRDDLDLALPVIAMTANAMTGDIDKCLAIGMNAHIPKPIEPEYLYQKLADILAHKLITAPVAQENGQKTLNDPDSSHEKSAPRLADKKCLLVEDNKLNRKVAVGFLAETEAHISVAKNGEKALEMLRASPDEFDIVFMDIQMPGMDGITATKKIRTELQLTLPIIAMTASAADRDIKEALESGMNAHVAKPIESDKLYAVIRQFLPATDDIETRHETGNVEDFDLESELNKLTQINKLRAIQNLNGKADMYNGLVQDFIAMQPEIVSLEEAVESKDISTIKRIVHTYKSGLAYVGAYALTNMGKQLDRELTADIESLEPELEDKLKLYISAIDRLTESLKAGQN